ncbi:MAG: HlyD family efflux transporter periplasmic adaptor subunit [Anaerolineae bacterium]
MKSLSTITELVLVSVMVLLVGCQDRATPSPTPTLPTNVSTQPDTTKAGRMTALGTVLPAQQLKLSFSVGGGVRGVKVQVGTEVNARDLLAELDTADLELAAQEAEDGLALNQALLDQASAGAREQELAIAQAEYRRALAQHEQLRAGARPEELAGAQADYQAALASYEQVKSGASQEELIAAQAAVAKAEAALQQAQAAYDVVAWRPGAAASPQAAALQEASIDYQAAKAQYERLKNLPTEADLQEAKANLAHAEAQLELEQAGPTEQEVMASASSVAIAQAQLELTKAGSRPEDVAVVEAQMQQAHTILEKAKQALPRGQLLAPFDGTISAVYLSQGEWAEAGAPVVELLDTTRWRVETRNVSELNIGRIGVGQEAIVRVMAFRGEELRGRVDAISPVAVVQQGDTTYTVFIELEPTDLNLRPGMNAEVAILTE